MKTQTKPDEQRQLPFGTRHNLDPFACLSALQKCIRRGVEREAMEFACELLHSTGTGPQFLTMVTNRLEIITGAGHPIPVEKPRELAGLINGFLGAHD